MRIALLAFFLLCSSAVGLAQQQSDTPCVSPDDIERMMIKLGSTPGSALDKKLRGRLVDLKKDTINRFWDKAALRERENNLTRGVFGIESRLETREKAIDKKRDKSEDELCDIFRTRGWPTLSLVGEPGTSALFYVLKNFISFGTQTALVPVISLAVSKGEVPLNEDYAAFLDRLRLRSGLKQLFGTQASEKNGFLVLSPIQSAEKIDGWRAKYKMPPLNPYMKFLESTYRMPSIRGLNVDPPTLRNKPKLLAETQELSRSSVGNEDTIRVDSNIVDLTVRVLSKDFRTNVGSLERKDFKIFENNVEQEIAYFSRSATAFDLVLLLDLSGSTALKQDLIRKSAKRFVEAARPDDRIAIVTFTNKIDVLSELTSDREALIRKTGKIGSTGGSFVWDSLKFAIERMFGDRDPKRRRAVVMMSDGADNALLYVTRFAFGSRISFAELVETVRANDAAVVPIYIDTEDKSPCAVNSPFNCTLSKRVYEQARATLSFLAEESGGQLYYAAKFEDLNGVYERVLDDLSTGYGVAYQPTDDKRDGKWREIRVEVINRPDVVARTRRGYYAK
ncbi:MAG: VWA domain-containing protein [Acidobacteria bacterium]|nr:VWA domain-containing protein [Acidobacteriota bacterium]